MALQTINIGNFVNDGTGDDLRTAFTKINDNFDQLDLSGGQNNTASNIGLDTAGAGLWKEKVGTDLRFKRIKGGNGITIQVNPNDLTIVNQWPAIASITADDQTHIAATTAPKSITVAGSGGVHTTTTGDTLTIDGRLQRETTPRLGANLDLNGHNIHGVGSVISDLIGSVFADDSTVIVDGVNGKLHGDLIGTVYSVDIRNLDSVVNGFDFGRIAFPAPRSFYEFLFAQYDFDFGTFTAPASVDIDGGPIV
jgi:hypothetical protein